MFKPKYLHFVFSLIFWFFPLLSILFIAIWIAQYLYYRNTKIIPSRVIIYKKSIVSRYRNFRLTAVHKFIIIIMVYWIQWMPPCIITSIMPFMSKNFENHSIVKLAYWLTFTVCLADPLTILILNPNVTFRQRKKKRTIKKLLARV